MHDLLNKFSQSELGGHTLTNFSQLIFLDSIIFFAFLPHNINLTSGQTSEQASSWSLPQFHGRVWWRWAVQPGPSCHTHDAGAATLNLYTSTSCRFSRAPITCNQHFRARTIYWKARKAEAALGILHWITTLRTHKNWSVDATHFLMALQDWGCHKSFVTQVTLVFLMSIMYNLNMNI